MILLKIFWHLPLSVLYLQLFFEVKHDIRRIKTRIKNHGC